MSKFWEMKMSAQPKTLDLYIYSEVMRDSMDLWTGERIESETSSKYFRDALEKAGPIDNINVYINSVGGSVTEGTAIYNQLKRHSAYKTAYIDAFACSVASVIPMACDKVVMPKNSAMYLHNMMDFCFGNAKEHRKVAGDLDILMEACREAYLLKAGDKLSEEKLIEMLDAETWLTAEQCIEYGLADEYAEKDVDLTEAKKALAKQLPTQTEMINTLLKVPKEEPEQETEEKDQEDLVQKNDTAVKLMTAFINSFKH